MSASLDYTFSNAFKRVLIITYYWPPAGGGGVQRWVKFAKYMHLFGWKPTIFTVSNGEYPIIDESLAKEVPSDIEVIHSHIIEPFQIYKSLFGKKGQKIDANFLSQGKKVGWKDALAIWVRGNFFIPDARAFWRYSARKKLSKVIRSGNFDAIISTGPPHTAHLLALDCKKLQPSLPWIVDYRDPWTQIDYFDDLRLTSIARNKHIALEKKVLNACNVIVTVGKTMAKDLNLITNTKKVVITNGYDTEDIIGAKPLVDENLTITYIGTMNDGRNPIGLWKAIAQLKKESAGDILNKLIVKIVGKVEQVVLDTIQSLDIEKYVNFVGYVSHHEAIQYQNKAQVLLLVINNTNNNKSILTGKIFEYIASGRPILCIGPTDGDAAEVLSMCKTGKVVDYNAIDEIKNYIINAYHNANNDIQITDSSQIEQFSRLNLTKNMCQLLDETIRRTI